MPTGTQIVTNVATKLNLMPGSGGLGADDTQTILTELNDMWDRLSIDEGLIYGQTTYQSVLAAGRGVYSIGPNGDLNTTRPARIYKAFVLGVTAFTATTTSGTKTLTAIPDTSALALGQQVIGAGIPSNSFITAIVTNTSATISNAATASATLTASIYVTTGNRNEIRIVEAGQYYDHNDLGALARTPDEIYPDYLPFTTGADGAMNLYLFPVPSAAGLALELDMAVPFSVWALAVNYNIPPGYRDMIVWATAFRCLAPFGIAIDSQVGQVVAAEGQKAEAAIREMNARNRQLPPPEVMTPAAQINPQAAVGAR